MTPETLAAALPFDVGVAEVDVGVEIVVMASNSVEMSPEKTRVRV